MYLDLIKLFKPISKQLQSIITEILESKNISFMDNFDYKYPSIDQLIYLFDDNFKKDNIVKKFTVIKEEEDIKLKIDTGNKITWFKNDEDDLYLLFCMELQSKKQYYDYIQLYDILYRFGLHPKMFTPYNTREHSYILYNINNIEVDDFKLLSLDFFDSYDKKKITKFNV